MWRCIHYLVPHGTAAVTFPPLINDDLCEGVYVLASIIPHLSIQAMPNMCADCPLTFVVMRTLLTTFYSIMMECLM